MEISKRNEAIMVEMVRTINEVIDNETYLLTIDEEVVGEYEILGQVSEAILSYFDQEIIKPIHWDSEEPFFYYRDTQVWVEINDRGKFKSITPAEKTEILLYLSSDEDMSDKDVQDLESNK